jgi:hypothetical protein
VSPKGEPRDSLPAQAASALRERSGGDAVNPGGVLTTEADGAKIADHRSLESPIQKEKPWL